MAEHTPTTAQVRERFIDGATYRATATGLLVTPYSLNRAREDFDRWLAAHDAELRAEVEDAAGGIWREFRAALARAEVAEAKVERLREVSAAQPYETERELAVALDEARRALADLRAQYVRKGVCLLCGGAVLDSGEHIDPERHAAEVERIVAGSGEQPGEADRAYAEGRWCGECRYGQVEDPPCCTHPAPAVPDSAGLRGVIASAAPFADLDALDRAVARPAGQEGS